VPVEVYAASGNNLAQLALITLIMPVSSFERKLSGHIGGFKPYHFDMNATYALLRSRLVYMAAAVEDGRL
jgi:hypothetical protein